MNAVSLAITLNQPFRVLTILTGTCGLVFLATVAVSSCLCLDLLNEGGVDGDFTKTLYLLREDQIRKWVGRGRRFWGGRYVIKVVAS